MIRLTNKKIDVTEVIRLVESPDGGAINVFIGTVRNRTKKRKVVRLEFEAYEAMALRELKKISDEAHQNWPILNLAIFHAVGTMEIGEVPVVIAVSTAHREASFEACRFIIDQLKKTVPIWKKEFFEDGEVWVSAHP